MAIEPISSTTLVTAVGAKLAYDVLGPSAKYLGGEFRDLTAAGVTNLKRVLEKAKKHLEATGAPEGAVPPRLLLPILSSACFCEDEVVASYLGGVLCSARTAVGRDDRAVSVLKVIDGLSTYALRAHAIVYVSSRLQQKFSMSELRHWLERGQGVTVLFREEDLASGMEFAPEEDAQGAMDHAFVSLHALDLCREGLRPSRAVGFDGAVRWMRLTLRGVELFCWGNGCGRSGIGPYFQAKVFDAELSGIGVAPARIELGKVSFS